MATFVLLDGYTFQANHFGLQGTGHDGIQTNVAFHGSTYPTPGSYEQSFYDGRVDDPASNQVGLIRSLMAPFFPQSTYGDPGTGPGWSGQGIYDQTVDGGFQFVDFTQTGTGAPLVIGTLQGGSVDYTLLEYYTRDGDPSTGSYKLTWDWLCAANDTAWQLFGGDDDVTLGNGDDFFMDPGGRLRIDLRGGNDILDLYGDGSDVVYCGRGDDLTQYQGGFGRYYLGSGNDTIGPAGDNTGYDRFWGGTGEDTIYVAGPNSTINEENNSGSDHFYGDFTTTLSYEGCDTSVTVDIGAGEARSGDGTVDVLVGISRVVGSQGDDVLIGGSMLDGAGGDDTISGSGYKDTLKGGLGVDLLSFAGYSDSMRIDLVKGTAGPENDKVSGFESVVAASGDDTIIGDNTANSLDGEAGDDRLTGGAGADRFLFGGNFGRDKVTDFGNGADRIDLTALAAVNGGAPLAFAQLHISVKGGSARIQLDLNENGKADSLDLDGDGIPDNVRIDLAGVDPPSLTAADFLF